MVLFVSCPTSSLISSSSSSTSSTSSFSSSSCSTQEFYYELTTTTTMDSSKHAISQPIPVGNPTSWNTEAYSTSPLATSTESVDSIKSSYSSRSSAERDAERHQRRQLLNVSLNKLHGTQNMPLCKHLLVFNTVKALQRDLDILDDEELYCSLLGGGGGVEHTNSSESTPCDMEVDEACWMKMEERKRRFEVGQQEEHHLAQEHRKEEACDKVAAVEMISAPPKQEELKSHQHVAMDEQADDFEMEDLEEPKTWSWTNEPSLFDLSNGSQNDPLFSSWKPKDSFASWLMDTDNVEMDMTSPFGGSGCGSGNEAAAAGMVSSTVAGVATMTNGWDLFSPSSMDGFDLWGGSKFDLRHLFPSQLLMQA